MKRSFILCGLITAQCIQSMESQNVLQKTQQLLEIAQQLDAEYTEQPHHQIPSASINKINALSKLQATDQQDLKTLGIAALQQLKIDRETAHDIFFKLGIQLIDPLDMSLKTATLNAFFEKKQRNTQPTTTTFQRANPPTRAQSFPIITPQLGIVAVACTTIQSSQAPENIHVTHQTENSQKNSAAMMDTQDLTQQLNSMYKTQEELAKKEEMLKKSKPVITLDAATLAKIAEEENDLKEIEKGLETQRGNYMQKLLALQLEQKKKNIAALRASGKPASNDAELAIIHQKLNAVSAQANVLVSSALTKAEKRMEELKSVEDAIAELEKKRNYLLEKVASANKAKFEAAKIVAADSERKKIATSQED